VVVVFAADEKDLRADVQPLAAWARGEGERR
jgi:hypothetical protein